ncbi:MAG: hypothetical protein ACKVPX_18500 [Myxococcaceae bacterium]
MNTLRWVWVLFAMSSQAFATPKGAGRIALLAGWRLTPNDHFARAATDAGAPLLRTSPGGPSLAGSFSYAILDELEISLDLFGSGERLALANRPLLTNISYGGLFWLRGMLPLMEGRLLPSLAVGTGAVLVLVSGAGLDRLSEKLVQGWVAAAGILWQFDANWGMGFEYRYLHARGFVPEIGSINGGGSGFHLLVSYTFAAEPDRPRMLQ